MLILASESPRRRELLKRLVPEFQVISPNVDELEEGEDLESLPEKNALLKAGAVADRFPEEFVIGADTAVFAGNMMLGKPASPDEAVRMLSLLSGKTHRVISGSALICRQKGICCSWSDVTQVTFAPLSSEVIALYMEKVNVLDKAGAYAVQEFPELLGARWDGELENIIGLPLVKLSEMLKKYSIIDSLKGAY